jgi:hypothetical protein
MIPIPNPFNKMGRSWGKGSKGRSGMGGGRPGKGRGESESPTILKTKAGRNQ